MIFKLLHGCSYYFVLKDNGSLGTKTGATHSISFLPNQMYCFLPSSDLTKVDIEVLDYIPEYLKDFQYCLEIEQVPNKMFVFFYLTFISGWSIFTNSSKSSHKSSTEKTNRCKRIQTGWYLCRFLELQQVFCFENWKNMGSFWPWFDSWCIFCS